MLSGFQGKRIKVITEDGETFSGIAEALPSGYGLHEFGVEEESLEIGGVTVFQSDIARIELLEEPGEPVSEADRHVLMGDLLEGPYDLADILPRRVPADSKGQYFAVERYFRLGEPYVSIRKRFAEILLLLNCYYDVEVSFDDCETWERDPDPEMLVRKIEETKAFIRFLFIAEESMIDFDNGDTYMTVYTKNAEFRKTVKALTEARGLFFRAGDPGASEEKEDE